MEFSSESFNQILDAVEDIIFVKDSRSRLIYVNRAFLQHVNMTREQLIGQLDSPVNPAEYLEGYLSADAKVFASGTSIEISDEPFTRHDGVVRRFHTLKSPIRNEKGEVTLMVGIARDITDRKETEARALYSAKMASLGQMAASVAHEINNPLTVITGLAEVTSELLEQENPDLDQVREKIAAIERTARKIGGIVSGLRNFSRDGRADPFVTARLSEIIEETLAFSKQPIEVNHIALEVNIVPDGPLIKCRPVQIGQVILNLLNNACDAVAPLESKWIRIESAVTDGYVEVAVTDSGTGIDKKLHEKVFAPFFTTKESGKGTGLGLSISRGIAEAHGGQLVLDATSKNTRFVLRLPRSV